MPIAFSPRTAAMADSTDLAGDEPRRHRFREPVFAHEAEELRLPREVEKRVAKHSVVHGMMRVATMTGAVMRATGNVWFGDFISGSRAASK